MASENLVNDLFEIVQSNTKEKLSYNDFEKDLLNSINLQNDEIDRALALMISQAQVNPNVIGETKGGTFIVSSSFSAAVISTIKYENQFIEGKIENINRNEMSITGVILTAELIDKMLDNFELLTNKDLGDLFDNYANLSDDQQRKLDQAHVNKMKELEEQAKAAKDKGVEDAAGGLAKKAKLDAAEAEKVRSGDFDQAEIRDRMFRSPNFVSYLLAEEGITLTRETVIDKRLYNIFRGYEGKKEQSLAEQASMYLRCKELLDSKNFKKLYELTKSSPLAAKIASSWITDYQQNPLKDQTGYQLDDDQLAMQINVRDFITAGKKIGFEINEDKSRIKPNSKYAFRFEGTLDPELAQYQSYIYERNQRTEEYIGKGTKKDIQLVMEGVSNGLSEYGVDTKTISLGFNIYAETLDAVVSGFEVSEENGMKFLDEESIGWGSETYVVESYDKMFKTKLEEERDKIRNTNPLGSDVLDVMSGITYGGTIQERMKNYDSLKVFAHEVSHSVREIDKKIEKGEPLARKTDLEIETLMDTFMRIHAEDLLVGEIPTEKAPVQDDIGLFEGITQINAEPIIETPTVKQQEDVEIDKSKDDEIKEDEEGKEDKKSDFFSPSDFSSAKNLFSSIRTSAYVNMFEEVKSPLSQQDQKKTNEDQSRTDDDEPIQ